ncbi:hypothetical protein D5086_010397 [Populus alba]|uniref:Uncharacterized protein n=1 Tax=Populus alba TaxID=43335 RepID=A0ACC4C9A7_POPAL
MALQESTPKAQFRRTAEFHPSVWGDYFIKKAPCDEMLFSAWIKEVEVLKEEVRTMLTSATLKPSEKLKLMDIVLRLGIGYHFEGEFNGIIEHAYNTYHDNNFDDDLFTVALRFRLLREYGYNVSSGVPKHEQWHHILIYQQDEACPGAVLKLAKLDFNVLQKCYQDELRIISKWDTSMEDLPDYMKLFFEALIGFFDEIEQETAKEGRPYCVHYCREMLKNQARAYLTEARWFNQDCVPQLEEYRRAGVYTSCSPMSAVAWICGMAETGSKEAFEWMSKNPKIVVASSDIGRLMDDITSHEFEQERGHVASAVECCMKQYGVSKEEAYDMLRKMVESDWKDINEELLKPSTVPRQILILMLNLARIIDVLYKDHDGYTEARNTTKELLTAFLVDPLPVVA